MSNTTDTSHITYTPSEIEARIDAMITEERKAFVIITSRRSVSYTYGSISRSGNQFRCDSPDGLSYTVFHREDVESVGSTCIWLWY